MSKNNRNDSAAGVNLSSKDDDLDDLIRKRIDNLRPKLLDLSRRNPLVSTKLSPRSNSHIRVVDELPDVLYGNLSTQQEMRFVGLPALDEDPRDEQSRQFRDALSAARMTDQEWKNQVDLIDPSAEDSLEQERKLERQLKDRVREALKMAPRQVGADTSLAQHAKNNGIAPSYDLPTQSEQHADGRHTDKFIQTLLLPEDLERKMNGMMTKCRTWIQETGIHVLYAAFGFMEWVDSKSGEPASAPLVLIPVQVEKVKTREGLEFRVTGIEDVGDTNAVLAEKLRQDFGLELPVFEEGSLEKYFETVAKLSPKSLSWKIRRQVVFGVFPSARIAMFRDLDTSDNKFKYNEAVTKLLAGAASGVTSLFGDEYEVDQPEIEGRVPCVVANVDSSQFSTMVDIANGKDLAVEGPPGTGKSLTIVNTIAAMLYEGKKVLFVAEKLAALNVVKSRLEAIGLGEFILPLQAEKSTREQVVQSIRDRIGMYAGKSNPDLYLKTLQYTETRAELQSYIDAISSKVGATNYTVFDIIGKGVALNEFTDLLPRILQNPPLERVGEYDASQIEHLRELGHSLSRAWEETQKAASYWHGLKIAHLDRFTVDEVCDLAKGTAAALRDEHCAASALKDFYIDRDLSAANIQMVREVLKRLIAFDANLNLELTERLTAEANLLVIFDFLEKCALFQSDRLDLLKKFTSHPTTSEASALRAMHELCKTSTNATLDFKCLRSECARDGERLLDLRGIQKLVQPFVEYFPESEQWELAALTTAADLISGSSRKVLAIRSERSADPSAVSVIEQSGKLGRDLRAKQEKLEAVLAIPRGEILAHQLSAHIRSLSTKGIFSSFMPSFRAAKKEYLSLSRRTSFSRTKAVEDLTALVDWKDDEAKFLSNTQAQEVFGSNFGLELDFQLFDELLSFYEQVDSVLPGIANRNIRKFLKSGELDLLLSLPKLTYTNPGLKAADLVREIDVLDSELKNRVGIIDELERLATSLITPADISVESLLPLAEMVERHQSSLRSLEQHEHARNILGSHFNGGDTIRSAICDELTAAELIGTLNGNAGIVLNLLRERRLSEAHAVLDEYILKESKASAALSELSQRTGIELAKLCGSASKSEVAEYIQGAAGDRGGLYAHSNYEAAMVEIRNKGFDWLVAAMIEDGHSLNDLGRVMEAVIFRALSRFVYRQHDKILAKLPGYKLDECRARLARLDKEILVLAQQNLRVKLSKMSKPPSGFGVGRKSEWTDMALIENELSKKKRFISVRDLTHRAGGALLELKPCWMMSPLAVAQYLRKEDICFDLVIIDEASQMPPEDALGALIRAKQVMVVGDTNQLPPTTFFKKMVDDEDADEDETVLEESILEMANAAFRPARRLRWHYRSRHSALIKFSNHMVYDNDLIVFPAASEERPDMGVSLVTVSGSYSSGVNGDEAKAMVDATLQFMKNHPNRSLGLVTLNQKQRDLLLEQMEYALYKDSSATKYVETWKTKNDGLESFFIKNLENVQGDERDVIFIGTVYGPEKPGAPVMQRFGPINGLAGKRRLNVLFSRAKEQIVTFSSMTSEDIRAEEAGNPGVYMLKRWLEYSASGFINTGVKTNKSSDSDFEDFVMQQIRSMGFEPEPQVGAAGYFIDIGIKHPDWPYGYILGVECDGANYHSSKSARDRDRLRQEVLEGLGWHFHRIWSTDWFKDPRQQSERLREAIVARLNHLRSTKASLVNAP